MHCKLAFMQCGRKHTGDGNASLAISLGLEVSFKSNPCKESSLKAFDSVFCDKRLGLTGWLTGQLAVLKFESVTADFTDHRTQLLSLIF